MSLLATEGLEVAQGGKPGGAPRNTGIPAAGRKKIADLPASASPPPLPLRPPLCVPYGRCSPCPDPHSPVT